MRIDQCELFASSRTSVKDRNQQTLVRSIDRSTKRVESSLELQEDVARVIGEIAHELLVG